MVRRVQLISIVIKNEKIKVNVLERTTLPILYYFHDLPFLPYFVQIPSQVDKMTIILAKTRPYFMRMSNKNDDKKRSLSNFYT